MKYRLAIAICLIVGIGVVAPSIWNWLQTLPVACPDDPVVVAGFGQSKAGNSIPRIEEEPPIPSGLYEFFEGQCYRLQNATMGGTGRGASIYAALGRKMLTVQPRPVVFVVGAVGGQSARSLDEDIFPTFRQSMEGLSYPVDAFVHIQGETDARQGNTNFLPHTRSIFDEMYALSPDAPIITFLSTRCGEDQRYRERIRNYQLMIAEERSDVILAGDLDAFGPEYNNPNRCHLNQAGAEIVADQIVEAMIASGVIDLA